MCSDERRQHDGVHRVVRSDGNGGRESFYTIQKKINVTPLHAFIVAAVAVIGLAITVGTVAFNATRAGVAVQVKEGIEHEMSPRGGAIRSGIDRQIQNHEIESERELNKTLVEIKQGITRIETKQSDICRRIDRLESQ